MRQSLALIHNVSFLWIAALFCAPVATASELVVDRHVDMSRMLDEESVAWERIGNGASFLLDDGTCVINDNSNGERIAFQTLLGEVSATDEVIVRASLKVVSNLGGNAATIEIARPGLEAVLQLFPDHVSLTERAASGVHRWLGAANIDLSNFHEIELIKTSSDAAGGEQLLVKVDGVLVIERTPRKSGALDVGRILIGSTSYPDFGASMWDWIDVQVLEHSASSVRTEQRSFGSIKADFGF